MSEARKILAAIQADERYRKNLDWGEPRKGHPEGSIRAHIADLEANLEPLRGRLSEEEVDRLRVLIHVHDTFKPVSGEGIRIEDPRSHASLARAFLSEFTDDADLLAITQNHDVPYALWRQWKKRGRYDPQRLARLERDIRDWRLFLAFLIIDNCTEGKTREPMEWFFDEIRARLNKIEECDLWIGQDNEGRHI